MVRSVACSSICRGVLDAIIEQTDIDAVGVRVGELLDESLIVDRIEWYEGPRLSSESPNQRKPGT